MTLEKLREINGIASALVAKKNRLEHLDSLAGFFADYESDYGEKLELVRADVYGHYITLDADHFARFLGVEINHLEAEIESLEKQLESL